MAGFGGIFPNLWVTREGLILRVPKGPFATEMWRLSTMNSNPTPEEAKAGIKRTIVSQGPAGHFEVDDAENWALSTVGTTGTVTRRYPLHYGMGLGHGQVVHEEGGPPYIPTDRWTEHGQRWHYLNWAHWMSASNWSELKATRPPVPLTTL
jgi:3-phenylpropionate/trans-cinnamate dioxygenase alpha subunit